jgi:hypothetical protein
MVLRAAGGAGTPSLVLLGPHPESRLRRRGRPGPPWRVPLPLQGQEIALAFG